MRAEKVPAVIDNRFRKTLAKGRCSIGISPGFPSAEVVEFCALLGFDWVLVDAEHGALTIETCQTLVRAAHGAGAGVLLRTPSTEPHMVAPYLDTGAFSVLIPHVGDAQQARTAIDACFYPSRGTRGVGSTTRAANYGATQTAAEYLARANEIVMAIPMIEDMSGVTNIDDILRVPGVEAIVVGPGDLAASMGHAGQSGHPDVAAAVDTVIAKSKAAGRFVGTAAGTPAAGKAFIAKGVDFLLCNAVPLFAESARRFLGELGTTP
jgi:4-hydroxy-2-oxoheptanedioate aldolase